MKKLLSMILALAMVLALSTTVFAEDVPSDNITGDMSMNVTAEYTATDPISFGDKVYSVTVAWNQTGTLSYNAGTTVYKWNAAETKYEEDSDSSSPAGWTVTDAKVTVTVTNKSNAKIKASITANTNATSGLTVTGSFKDSKNSVEVDSAAEGTSATNLGGSAQQASVEYDITGVVGTIMTAPVNNTITVATLTISLTKVVDNTD